MCICLSFQTEDVLFTALGENNMQLTLSVTDVSTILRPMTILRSISDSMEYRGLLGTGDTVEAFSLYQTVT